MFLRMDTLSNRAKNRKVVYSQKEDVTLGGVYKIEEKVEKNKKSK